MAGAGGCNSGLYGRTGFLAVLNALKEIFHVIDGAIAIAVSCDNGILLPRHSFAVDGKSAAIDL